jgi:hypothetical protein
VWLSLIIDIEKMKTAASTALFWVTRERPKIDRIACPWLISRFINPKAQILYVPADQVITVAERVNGIPFDIDGVEMSHEGEFCTFDTIIKKFELKDEALQQLALIVRGADTARLDLAPECAGLLAFSLGLSQQFQNDQEQLQHGLVFYDSLYAWCKKAKTEKHDWNPQSKKTKL